MLNFALDGQRKYSNSKIEITEVTDLLRKKWKYL